MNLPLINRRSGKTSPSPAPSGGVLTLDDHHEQSRQAQRCADKWLIAGALLLGTNAAGIFGLPLFLFGLKKLRDATKAGLSVRPLMVTLIGYLVMVEEVAD